jgi:hypothetical protein
MALDDVAGYASQGKAAFYSGETDFEKVIATVDADRLKRFNESKAGANKGVAGAPVPAGDKPAPTSAVTSDYTPRASDYRRIKELRSKEAEFGFKNLHPREREELQKFSPFEADVKALYEEEMGRVRMSQTG